MEERIIKALREALKPSVLKVKNNSHLHQGHIEGGGSETHFKVTIAADGLKGLSRVKAHRAINQIIAEEFKNGLHALEIEVLES